MRTTLIRILAGCCFFAISLASHAQSIKPGLWDTTSNMTWQQSPMPAGMPTFGGGNHTSQVCITQEQIDKFGSPVAQQNQRNSCQMINVVKSANGMTAEMVCTGSMSGKANVQASWSDDSHSTSTMHFTGSMQMGSNSKPVEWTANSSSIFKSADCGKVKPMAMPANQ